MGLDYFLNFFIIGLTRKRKRRNKGIKKGLKALLEVKCAHTYSLTFHNFTDLRGIRLCSFPYVWGIEVDLCGKVRPKILGTL